MKYFVNIAMMQVARPPDVLCCLGLGSCVAVTLYDPAARVGGLIHVLLPSIQEFGRTGANRTKFADSGIGDLVEAVTAAGAAKPRLEAKMAGGAAMFATNGAWGGDNIGRRNVQACAETLRRLGIRLAAQDTGGTRGRTVTFEPGTGALTVRTSDEESKVI